MDIIKAINEEQMKTDIPDFKPGDTVRVNVKVVEGNKERIQYYDGVVISRKGSGIHENFTVRRTSFGVGIERIFPIHSPRIDSILVLRRGQVKRAKLYYLRNRKGKAARIRDKK